MPDQGVTDHRHATVGTEGHVAVLWVEREDARLPLDALELQKVFRRDAVELPGDKVDGAGVGAIALALIEGDADQPAFRYEVLERRRLRRDGRRHGRPPTGGHDTSRHRERLGEAPAIDPQRVLRPGRLRAGRRPGRGALYATPVAFARAFFGGRPWRVWFRGRNQKMQWYPVADPSTRLRAGTARR